MHVALRRLALAALLAVAAATATAPVAAEEPILRYQEILPGLADADPGPRVEIYADRRVIVHFPAYMRRAGTYTMRLAPQEFEALVANLLADGLAEFDAASVAAAREQVREEHAVRRRRPASEELHLRTDPTTTVIEARLGSVAPARRSLAPHTVRWSGLRADAEMYPELPALARLATAEQRLRALRERPELRPIDAE